MISELRVVMSFSKSLSSISLILLFIATHANAATFAIRNNCPYTVWPATLPSGGVQLSPGQTWTINVPRGTTSARIWGRTGCSFNGAGQGRCQTGDCNGQLRCQVSGVPPTTLAEYSLTDQDYFDISVIDGFNVPMEFSPTGGCSRSRRCAAADIIAQCPNELRAPGGCDGACRRLNICGESNFSRFYKQRCPDAYTYPADNTATVACPAGTNYRVVFCP